MRGSIVCVCVLLLLAAASAHNLHNHRKHRHDDHHHEHEHAHQHDHDHGHNHKHDHKHDHDHQHKHQHKHDHKHSAHQDTHVSSGMQNVASRTTELSATAAAVVFAIGLPIALQSNKHGSVVGRVVKLFVVISVAAAVYFMIKLSSTGADFNSLLLTLQSNMAPSHVWACTLGAIVAISILPLPFLFALKVKPGSRFMRVLLSFAVGSLLGDVFLHLLPHASHPHSHEHGHGHEHGHSQDTRVGQLVLLGMLLFFILEKLIRGMTAHSHAHTAEHQHNDQSARVGSRILHALADASHNFTDGMFLAASFLSAHRSNAGLPFYSMAVLYKPLVDVAVVLIHEIPHEIGDFALHMQCGATKSSAIAVQLLTAFGAIVGGVCVLLLDTVIVGIDAFVLPITAGGFIYISLVNIVPTLFEPLAQSARLQTVWEAAGMCVGAGLMMLVSVIEEQSHH